jgi:hypothetical protein
MNGNVRCAHIAWTERAAARLTRSARLCSNPEANDEA